ncbi:NmrA-like family protein [Annulohypoxylon moriforme]|nr:NmrA-like family protein [Annulohypoxylon moriforme]
MAPTILIVGATGNTGRGVVETLSKLHGSSNALKGHRLLALTRSASTPTAQQIAKLPDVEVAEQNWVEITPEWLRENEVVRAFIAPHNQPNQFAEESTFHVAALHAGVKYVVRISTTAANVRPDLPVYYPRSHWAIEALLSSPEFKALQWTSLQPNTWSTLWLASAAAFIKEFRETGKQGTLALVASEEAPVAVVDPNDVGALAGHLLALDDPSAHSGQRYDINGPEDITGKQIVTLVEQYIGEKLKNPVVYKDVSFVEQFIEHTIESKNVMSSIRGAPQKSWDGEATASRTSKEVLKFGVLTHSPTAVLKTMVG